MCRECFSLYVSQISYNNYSYSLPFAVSFKTLSHSCTIVRVIYYSPHYKVMTVDWIKLTLTLLTLDVNGTVE